MTSAAAIRANLERYFDRVPRASARVEEFGSLRLFVRDEAGHPYYARPTLGYTDPVTVSDLEAVLARQRELEVPQSVEWVDETTPSMLAVAEQAGLEIHRHPLMVHSVPGEPIDHAAAGVRLLRPDDPLLAAALAVPNLAFAEPGTQVGRAGLPELERQTALAMLDGAAERMSERIRAGRGAIAAAVDGDTVLCSGQHNPIGMSTEIVGVGTLPSARRRGLGTAVTAALLDDAHARGISTVFLSAGDTDVARIYARLGFRPVGTAFVAERAADPRHAAEPS